MQDQVWRSDPIMTSYLGVIFLAFFGFGVFAAYIGVRDGTTGALLFGIFGLIIIVFAALGLTFLFRAAVFTDLRINDDRFEYRIPETVFSRSYFGSLGFRRGSIPLDAVRSVEVHDEPRWVFGLPMTAHIYSAVTTDETRIIFGGGVAFDYMTRIFAQAANGLAAAKGLELVNIGTFEKGAEPAASPNAPGAAM